MAREFKLLRLSFDAGGAVRSQRSARTDPYRHADGRHVRQRQVLRAPNKCLDLDQLSDILRTSTDPAKLLDAWRGWHTVSPPMRPLFRALCRAGQQRRARTGLRRHGRDVALQIRHAAPDAFPAEMDRLWEQVKPLYRLAARLRALRSCAKNTATSFRPTAPFPRNLLGNMWAQEWENIYPLVAPKDADPGYDLTAILKARNTQPLEMVQYGERFFTSLGFAPLPKTFWERSLFVKPRDRDVVCHASAWDVDAVDDLRLKMCIEINAEDFSTVHHELGHNFYQRAYDQQPFLFRDSANDGFHEAIGDTIALSVTPEYLKKIGLLADRAGQFQRHRPAAVQGARKSGVPAVRADDRQVALAGVLGRRFRPTSTTQAWWKLRLKYQGVAPPIAAQRSRFRSRRQVSCRRQFPLCALFPGRHSAVPVSSRAVEESPAAPAR